MPVLVQFGAGNIGRGFVAPLFNAAGWEVVFVDVDPAMLAALGEGGRYTVTEVADGEERAVDVAPVHAVDGRDLDTVAEVLAGCDLAATAVGLAALPRLAPVLAAGLRQRGAALDVLVCENGPDPAGDLAAALRAEGGDLPPVGCVRTSIGRMVPPPTADADPLAIRVEPYARLPVARADFVGPVPTVAGLEAVEDFALVLRQKLFLHNMTHAVLAYGGAGRGYRVLPECAADPELVGRARRAAEAVGAALAAEHAPCEAVGARIRADCEIYVKDLVRRYANRALADPVARVGRDPLRKLAPGDRLCGAARLVRRHGGDATALAHAILDACGWVCASDDPSHNRWPAGGTWREVLAAAGLAEEDEPMSTVELAARQRESAEMIRKAGLHLKDEEVEQIEIADLGLGRYEEIGLGIYVYVNTDRCCAKELTMLPGQICPEHWHPPVDGEPGKEETFRCRWGEVHLFVPGHRKDGAEEEFALSFVPEDKRDTFTVYKHVHLKPGDQYTLKPNTPHWFVSGPEGAVVSEFSSRSRDDDDLFTDRAIERVPEVGPHVG